MQEIESIHTEKKKQYDNIVMNLDQEKGKMDSDCKYFLMITVTMKENTTITTFRRKSMTLFLKGLATRRSF